MDDLQGLVSQTKCGTTTEGMHFEAVCWYPAGAPAGTDAVRITGWYNAADGGGTFDVPRAADLPFVVFDGEWPA